MDTNTTALLTVPTQVQHPRLGQPVTFASAIVPGYVTRLEGVVVSVNAIGVQVVTTDGSKYALTRSELADENSYVWLEATTAGSDHELIAAAHGVTLDA